MVKHQKTQNVKLYKVVVSKFQNFEFLTLKVNMQGKILYKILKN